MKVAVLLHWNEGEDSGVFKKVVSQIHTWMAQGIHASVHVISRRPHLNAWQRHLGNCPLTFHLYRGVVRFGAWEAAVKAVQAHHPDLVYHRYGLYMPQLKGLVRSFPLILEINTDDLKEYCLNANLRCWYNRLTRGLLLRKAAGLVFVTGELAGLPHFARFRKLQCVIGNGVVLDDCPVLPPPRNRTPRLIFLGTGGQPWHGVDKVIRLAERLPTWRFDLVGPTPGELGRIPGNVSVHGRLERRGYEPVLAQADVALGTLALHRKGMNEASPLKVREYLAYGLPAIIAYRDSDFPRGSPLILELPNTEHNVEENLSAIEAFVCEWMGQRVPRDGLSHLDVGIKEAQRIAFFREVLRRCR